MATTGIKIESGCIKVPGTQDRWAYGRAVMIDGVIVKDYQNPSKEESEIAIVTFYGDGEGAPNIGDFIVGGQLVRKTEPQVAPSNPGKWERYFKRHKGTF